MVLSALVLLVLAPAALAGDKDNDGFSNKVDQCREEPEDRDGFEDNDGCPDLDNDADGMLDVDDKCPDEAEDTDGFEDEDGCPDPDNDGDGVADENDRCDGEIEPADEPDRDGCPTVSLRLLTEDGWLFALDELTDALLAAVGEKEAGCDAAAAAASQWVASRDPVALQAQFDARLARGAEPFDPESARELAHAKGALYPQIKPALDVFCRDHGGWNGIQPQVEAVFAPWLAEPTAAP
jgi:hypothetical protein